MKERDRLNQFIKLKKVKDVDQKQDNCVSLYSPRVFHIKFNLIFKSVQLN